jgi:hypothetical protein
MTMVKIYTGADLIKQRVEVERTHATISDAVYTLRAAYPAAYMFDDLECTDFVSPTEVPGGGFLYVVDVKLFFDTLTDRIKDLRRGDMA